MAKIMVVLWWRSLLLVVLLSLSGCASPLNRPVLLARLGLDKAAPTLVDVRSGAEFRRGHLPGAVNIPVQMLPFRLAQVGGKDKTNPVVVYCSHGPRAVLAGFILTMAGFREVQHLRGALAGWRADGLPVVQ